jgi:hypothetical protein
MADTLDDQIKRDLENRDVLEQKSKYLEAKRRYLPEGELSSEEWQVKLADKTTPELAEKLSQLKSREANSISARNSFLKKNDLDSARAFGPSINALKNDISIVKKHISSRGGTVPITTKGKVSTVASPSAVSGRARFKSIQEAMNFSKKTAEEILIPAKLVHSPGKFKSAFHSGMYDDDFAVAVQTLDGKHLDYVKREQAELIVNNNSFTKHKKLAVKLSYNKDTKSHFLAIGDMVGGSKKPAWKSIAMDLRSAEKGIDQMASVSIMDHLNAKISESPVVEQTVKTKRKTKRAPPPVDSTTSSPKSTQPKVEQPRAAKKPRVAAETGSAIPGAAKVVPKLDVVPGSNEKFGGKNGNRLMVGLSIAAGALLLWGASKQKGAQPLSESGVHNSLYGSNGMSRAISGNGYSPKTRVTPNGGGYATNIDMEATDNTGNTDYRAMASTMGSIASSSTGGGRSTTSLHIVDDSSRMDRESTRRSINQQLRE